MSYLQDRKNKKKKYFNLALAIVALAILFFLRNPLYTGLSYTGSVVFRPVLKAGQGIGNIWGNFTSVFRFKNSLMQENEELYKKLAEQEGRMANYNSLLRENEELKEILGRKPEKLNLLLAAILAKPNQSLYDTLVVDAGASSGIREGAIVFARGNIPIGRVSAVYPSSAKVNLFSSPGEKTEVVVSGTNIYMNLVGRGGGNFEMILPREMDVAEGMEVVLPGITPNILARVKSILTDPRDAFKKALLATPVNIQELKFVEVRI